MTYTILKVNSYKSSIERLRTSAEFKGHILGYKGQMSNPVKKDHKVCTNYTVR